MKTNKIFIFFVSIFLLLTVAAYSQTAYYYAFDKKIFINEVKSKMIISFKRNNATDVKTIVSSTKTEWLNDNICILNVENTTKEIFTKNLLQIKGIKSVQPVYATNDGMEIGITDEIIMRFNKDVSQRQIDEIHKKYAVNVAKRTDLYQIVTVPQNADALEIANQYQLSGLVKYSHPNFIAKTEKHQTIPNDPYFVNQFYLHNTGQTMPNGHSGTFDADIDAPEAWDITKGNSNIIIAVIDEGVTSNHPDLPNNRQNRLNGSNFASGNVNDPSPTGNSNHGNSCAGVIAASHNTEGVAGIAPNCKIMPVRIPFGNIPSSTYADAITFAKNNGADILSNSWGYGSSDPNLFPDIVDAIEDATLNGRDGNGCVVVFSAGNTARHYLCNDNGIVTFPASANIDGLLTVGASDRYDRQADYSPTSPLIDIVAPSHRAYPPEDYLSKGLDCGGIDGETMEAWTIDIPGNTGYNPWPATGEILPNNGINNLAYTGRFGGTSHACPVVAGVAALMLSVNPDLTPQQIFNILTSTANKVGGYTYVNGKNNQMGYGRANAHAALESVVLHIFGNNSLYTLQQATYSVPVLPAGTTITWSVSNNVNILSGQGRNQITVTVCSGDSATVTATITGTVNQTLTKTITVNNGSLTVTPSIGKMQVTLSHPYAQCFDWFISSEITGSTTTNIVGSGSINCVAHSSLTFKGVSRDPSVDDEGYIQVRAKNNSCNTPWRTVTYDTWQPEIDLNSSNLTPSHGGSFYAVLKEGYSTGSQYWDGKYFWHLNNVPLGYTYAPYISSSSWNCGNNELSVWIVDMIDEVYGYANVYGSCAGTYSAAYPNPASTELTIDKTEDTNNNFAVQNSKAAAKPSTVKVLLYSHGTTKLVYSKDYSSEDRQIKIDTSKLPNGVYYLNIIENGEKIKEQTIVINH